MIRILEKIAREINIFCEYHRHKDSIRKVSLDDRIQNLSSDERSLAITKRLAPIYYEQKELEDKIPLPYRPGGAWREDINTRRAEYLEALSENNIDKLNKLLCNFFRNSGVAGLWSIAYFEKILRGSSLTKIKFVKEIFKNFIVWKKLVGADIKELEVPSAGNPWGYLIDGILTMPNSFSHHYYVNRIKRLFLDSQRPIICEIGGGYGGFAYYLNKTLNSCVYINFDLPEILLICSYYLMINLPHKKILLFDKSLYAKPLSILEDYDIILMPNYMLPFLIDKSVDITVNTHSLSEMDYQTVEEYIQQIDRVTRRYFFHVNSDEAVPNTGGHLEIKSSDFPIDRRKWKNIYTVSDPFSESGRYYKEYLYQRYGKD